MLFCAKLIAQVPPNDLCLNAIELNIDNTQCNSISFTLTNATASQLLACSGGADDIWFKLNVPNDSAALIKIFDAASTTDPKFAIYKGDCNNLELYECDHFVDELTDTTYYVIADTVLLGESIYIRMIDSNDATEGSEICVSSIDIFSLNNSCERSKELIYTSFDCDPQLTLHDTLLENLYLYGAEYDLWYDITLAPQTRVALQVTGEVEDMNSLYFELFQGACNDLDQIDNGGIRVFDGARVIVLENSLNQEELFKIKITDIPLIYDIPISICARELGSISNLICETSTEISFKNYPDCEQAERVDYATVMNDDIYDDISCSPNVKDAWFTFDDGDSIDAIIISLITSIYSDSPMIIELFNGDQCTDIELIDCQSYNFQTTDASFVLSLEGGLTSKWYVRISTFIFDNFPVVDFCFSVFENVANDDCLHAVLLDLDGSCFEFVNLGATPSGFNFCNNDNDVWLKFMYDHDEIVLFNFDHIGSDENENYRVSFFRGSCDDLIPIECNLRSDLNTGSLIYELKNPDLIGQMIYASFSFSSTSSLFTNFKYEFCGFEKTDGDTSTTYCSKAREIEISDDLFCDTYNHYSFSDSKYSGIGNRCNLEGIGFDAWFTCTLPQDGRFAFELTNVESVGNSLSNLLIYQGDCEQLELIYCIPIENEEIVQSFIFNSLASEAIYFQLFTDRRDSIDFDICVRIPIQNDDCINAIELDTLNKTCVTPYILNNIDAASSEIDLACPGYHGKDVWYKCKIPASGKLVVASDLIDGSVFFDGAFGLYIGTCDNLVFLDCDDDSGNANMPAYIINDITLANQDLYIQFYAFNGNQEGTFSLCIFEPNANDSAGNDCEEAIQASVISSDQCYQNDETIVAFISNDFSGENPDCSSQIISDIWFEFDYIKSQRLVFEFKKVDGSFLYDGQAALYRSNCDSLILISCNDDGGPSNMPAFDLENVIDPSWDFDQTFYVQFWDFNQGIGDFISYCLYEKQLVNQSHLNTGNLLISPNPLSDYLQINVEGNDLAMMNWSIVNVDGKQVLNGQIDQPQTNGNFQINTKKLMAGTYIIRINGVKHQWVQKIVKM